MKHINYGLESVHSLLLGTFAGTSRWPSFITGRSRDTFCTVSYDTRALNHLRGHQRQRTVQRHGALRILFKDRRAELVNFHNSIYIRTDGRWKASTPAMQCHVL